MKKSIFVAVFLLIASMAMADTLNLTGPYSFTYNGVIVGPVGGNLNGVTPLTVICNDYNHTSYLSSSFGVDISTIPSLVYARFGNDPATLVKYERAAWLMWQMPLNPSEVGGIQFAMWNLFATSTPDPAGSDTWLAAANAVDVSAFNYSNIRVYTPTSEFASNQEFMGEVPEPATTALVGMGLFAFGGVFRWRRVKKE